VADKDPIAIRAVVRGQVQGVGFRDGILRRARTRGVMGWVRNGEEGELLVHAEGDPGAVEELVAFLRTGPPLARVAEVALDRVALEGHEQFALRGVSAGGFVVFERGAGRPRFELGLEVGGITRSWALSREPTLDPALKRLAIELTDRPATPGGLDAGGVSVWDRGTYEQGGRVPWPEALTRGHAVFVLRGRRLRGGFALQRTRPGPPAQWLLIKRRDEHASPGARDTAERAPQSGASRLSGDTRPPDEKVP
jgi:DNA ligase D-like protein (predicted 3'-phosphoesterase)